MHSCKVISPNLMHFSMLFSLICAFFCTLYLVYAWLYTLLGGRDALQKSEKCFLVHLVSDHLLNDNWFQFLSHPHHEVSPTGFSGMHFWVDRTNKIAQLSLLSLSSMYSEVLSADSIFCCIYLFLNFSSLETYAVPGENKSC